MFHRLVKVPLSRSFFLFGARSTGKSTLLNTQFDVLKTHWLNLLDLNTEARLARDPMEFEREVLALHNDVTHVVVDEVQKLPKLLDVVHNLIETHKVPQVFVLTGSSARKLKMGGANLLAGRAAVRHLFPLTYAELGAHFQLDVALRWGGLPSIWNTSDDDARIDFLRAYANTYLKEEIWGEQLVRQIDPFRRFLEVAAHQSGKILNYSKIGKDVGSDVKTIQSWYGVLEDTLVGFHLNAYHSSVRKQLRQAPKFYLFDVGVTRALAHLLSVIPTPQTSYYGDVFEQMVICQLNSRNSYEQLDYRLHYLTTKSGVEIDLVIERPGKPLALVEIKSAKVISADHTKSLQLFLDDFPSAELFVWSNDPKPQSFGRIQAVPWYQGVSLV